MAVAMTQMARYYGFPAGVNVALSDANVADAQAGLEKGLSLLAGALAGADIYGHQGIAGADQGASLEQLVIDNEMASLVRRMLRGFDVTDETLALDVIEQVGVGGNFLAQPHTVRHFRHELWQPTLLNRRGWEQWREAGGKTLLDEAIARKHELLATHSVPPLPEDLDAEISRIVAAAERVTGDG
jgi:trimethylamine--corrinoid protein Co-methyltransferase